MEWLKAFSKACFQTANLETLDDANFLGLIKKLFRPYFIDVLIMFSSSDDKQVYFISRTQE